MKICELGVLLGYNDTRSIEKWCKKVNIPILIAGKIKYVYSILVELHFQNSLEVSLKANNINASEIMDAIKLNDTLKLINAMGPSVTPVARFKKEKKQHSKATQGFLNNIKTG